MYFLPKRFPYSLTLNNVISKLRWTSIVTVKGGGRKFKCLIFISFFSLELPKF